MDVRCERCRAQYVFEDDQVTAAGLTVKCTGCGHVFRVKKKEIVVTVAVKPGDLHATPLPADAVGPRSGAGTPVVRAAREWRIRRAGGAELAFREPTTLQRWVVERKVARDDELAQPDGSWKRLGDLEELRSFFEVVEAAERGRGVTPPAPAPPSRGPIPPPPSGFPPPSFAMPPPGRAAAAATLAAGPAPAPAEPAPAAEPVPAPAEHEAGSVEIELDVDQLAAVRKRRSGGRGLPALALVAVVAGGVAAYVLVPQLLRGRKAQPPRPAPVELAPPVPAPPPAAPPPAPPGEPAAQADGKTPGAPAPGADGTAPVEPAPQAEGKAPAEPVPGEAAAPAPAPPRSRAALLAQAGRLRERGKLEEALDLYGQVIAEAPDNVEALTGRGLCYLDLERYPSAEASFRAALGSDPRQADALLGLAETYRWQGKRGDAIRYYERYLAAHPDGEEAQVARNALEELRK